MFMSLITSTEVMNNGYQQTYHSSKFIINGQTKQQTVKIVNNLEHTNSIVQIRI
jgi:hypothetical protein